MRRRTKAPSSGSAEPPATLAASAMGTTIAAGPKSRGLFGLACLCVLGLAALLGSGAPSAGAAGACPNEAFRSGPSANLPDCRAYEMVSPVDKNGGDVAGGPTSTRAAADGSAVSFLSFSGFADVSGAGLSFEYISQRVAGQGWSTHSIQPRQEPQSASWAFLFQQPYYQGEFSDDLSKGVIRALSPLTDASNVASTRNLYLREDLRTPGAGEYELLTDSTTPLPAPGTSPNTNDYRPNFASASAEFGHVLFESRMNLTADAPPQPVNCAEDPAFCLPRAYEWDHGSVRHAGILPDSACGTPPCPAPSSAAGRGATGSLNTEGTISTDGSRVFFTAPVNGLGRVIAGSQLYMRDLVSETVQVNASERATPDPSGTAPATFWAATPDGSRVFFTTPRMLTDDDQDSSTDLYAYDATRPATDPDNLSRLSVDQEPDDGSGAGVWGVIGVSDDGRYVYFAAASQLVDGASLAGSGSHLYVWHDGTLRHIGYIDGTSINETVGLSAFTLAPQTARVTPDGTRMAFQSQSGVGLTGYDHGTACEGGSDPGCSEVYLFDAEANGGAGELVCASCNPSGDAATSDAGAQLRIGTGAAPNTAHRNRFLTHDGRRVFFTTGERLVPADTNGSTNDVYVYDVESATVSLISAGKGTAGSYFMDASADGDDAFFVTRDRLTGWDVDDNYDVYDARIGGGLPQPSAPMPPCSAEACQDPPSLKTSSASPASLIAAGPGARRSKSRKRCRKGTRKVRRNGKLRCVKKNARKDHRQDRANHNRRASR